MASQVVTANRLNDGLVVFLAAGGTWSERIEDGAVADTAEASAQLMSAAEAAAAAQVVVAPYLIDVIVEDAGVRPVRYREAIRAQGPSVRPDLGYQALKG